MAGPRRMRISGTFLAISLQLIFITVGAASVASLIVRVSQVELVGDALQIIQLYWNWTEWMAVHLVDWWFRGWFGIQLPRWALDTVSFWAAAGGMAVRGERQHYLSMEKIHNYRMSDDKTFWWIKRYTAAALLGPISVYRRARMAVMQAGRWIRSAIKRKDARSRELAWVYTRGSLEILSAIFATVLLDCLFFWFNRYQAGQLS